MINELEIQQFLARNDWEAIGRAADFLAVHHHMTTEQILGLFERLGGDVESFRLEFYA